MMTLCRVLSFSMQGWAVFHATISHGRSTQGCSSSEPASKIVFHLARYYSVMGCILLCLFSANGSASPLMGHSGSVNDFFFWGGGAVQLTKSYAGFSLPEASATPNMPPSPDSLAAAIQLVSKAVPGSTWANWALPPFLGIFALGGVISSLPAEESASECSLGTLLVPLAFAVPSGLLDQAVHTWPLLATGRTSSSVASVPPPPTPPNLPELCFWAFLKSGALWCRTNH